MKIRSSVLAVIAVAALAIVAICNLNAGTLTISDTTTWQSPGTTITLTDTHNITTVGSNASYSTHSVTNGGINVFTVTPTIANGYVRIKNNSTTNTGANVYIGIDGSSFPVIIPPTRTAGFWLAGDGTLQATTTVATTTISIGRAPNP
jgi:hypothetical protein